MKRSVTLKQLSFAGLVLLICGIAREASAQSALVARMIFPPRNYELALGDTITPVARMRNAGTVSSAAVRLFYRIENPVTGIAPYFDSALVPSIAAGDSISVGFRSYASNPNILSEVGTFLACLFLDSDSLNAVCTRCFGIRRTAVPFRDPSNGYSHTAIVDIPDQTLWTSLGATIVDGEDSTWDPPPPRDIGFYNNRDSLASPVMLLNRRDEVGNYYSGSGVGDTLNSFPINLQGKTHVNFHFDFMRAGKHHYPFGWDTAEMFGPESTILGSAGNVLRPGDSLIVEFKKPSAPAVNVPDSDWNEMAAIDGGHDFEFKSFFAQPEPGGWHVRIDNDTLFVPDTNNYFTADFRFRLRLKASNNASGSKPVDDADPWYIDNPMVVVPLEPDLELRWVRVVDPYTKVPQSQAVFPIYLDVLDNASGQFVATPFRVTVLDPQSRIVYSQEIESGVMQGQDTVLRFPDWDATLLAGNDAEYTVTATIAQLGVDSYTDDDSTYSKFYLNIQQGADAIQEFAYDHAGLTVGLKPDGDSGNDIPELLHFTHAGIGFNAIAPGSLAVKFHLVQADSVYGLRTYFDGDPTTDYIRISFLASDSNSCVPGDTLSVPGTRSTMVAQIGGSGGVFGAFCEYDLPKPLVLRAGTYWAAISQLGLTNMELGGDLSRGGGEFAMASNNTPSIVPMYNSQYGNQWGSGSEDNDGNVSCSFAVETPAGSGNWRPMMPKSGLWPAMDSSSDLWLTMPFRNSAPFVRMGTYLPMIRVMLGNSVPSSVSSSNASSPALAMRACSPNPFNPTDGALALDFVLPRDEQVSLIIYNTLGTAIRTIEEGRMSSGENRLAWNGRDNSGGLIPAGTYVATLKTPDGVSISKFLVVR